MRSCCKWTRQILVMRALLQVGMFTQQILMMGALLAGCSNSAS